jgi:hypothetical protein
MKMKKDVVIIIILLIICFVVIPLISQLFVQEGFYSMNTIEVNRVLKKVGDKELKNAGLLTDAERNTDLSFNTIRDLMLTKEDRPGQDVSYNFCIGKLTCDNSYQQKMLPFKDNDNTNLYYPYCVSGNLLKDLRCEGGIKSKAKEGDLFDASGYTPNFSFNRYQTSESNPFYFTQYELNADKSGRKKVKDLLECDYVGDSKIKYECSKQEMDTRSEMGAGAMGEMNDDFLKDIFQQLLQIANNANNNNTNNSNSNSNNRSSSSSSSGSGEAIKCIADFGTKIGDNLCCGQTGVLQDTKYTCPNTLPYCSDFKCGSKFGTCRK